MLKSQAFQNAVFDISAKGSKIVKGRQDLLMPDYKYVWKLLFRVQSLNRFLIPAEFSTFNFLKLDFPYPVQKLNSQSGRKKLLCWSTPSVQQLRLCPGYTARC